MLVDEGVERLGRFVRVQGGVGGSVAEGGERLFEAGVGGVKGFDCILDGQCWCK